MKEENVSTSHSAVVQSSQEELPTSAPLEQMVSCAKLEDVNQTSTTSGLDEKEIVIKPEEILKKII